MNFSYGILKFPRNKVVVMHHLVKVWKYFMLLYVKCPLGCYLSSYKFLLSYNRRKILNGVARGTFLIN